MVQRIYSQRATEEEDLEYDVLMQLVALLHQFDCCNFPKKRQGGTTETTKSDDRAGGHTEPEVEGRSRRRLWFFRFSDSPSQNNLRWTKPELFSSWRLTEDLGLSNREGRWPNCDFVQTRV